MLNVYFQLIVAYDSMRQGELAKAILLCCPRVYIIRRKSVLGERLPLRNDQ
jgi:hypothetical protein